MATTMRRRARQPFGLPAGEPGGSPPAATTGTKGRRRTIQWLLLADICALATAYWVANAFFEIQDEPGRFGLFAEAAVFLVAVPLWLGLAKLNGLYRLDANRLETTSADELSGLLIAGTIATWFTLLATRMLGLAGPSLERLVLFWLLLIPLSLLARSLAREFARRSSRHVQNAVIIGAGSAAQEIARRCRRHPEYGVRPLAFVDADPPHIADDLHDIPVLRSWASVQTAVDRLAVERVIIAYSNLPDAALVELLRGLKQSTLRVDVVPRFYELVGSELDVHTVEGIPLVGLRTPELSRSSEVAKRAFDLVGAGLLTVALGPLLLLCALLIRLETPGGALYPQLRVGRDGRPFRIYKLRTMTADAHERKAELHHLNKHSRNGGNGVMFKIDDDPRVTRVGRYLRRYSLDEFPQLLNVLKGEMSLVGPRPIIPEEAQHVSGWGLDRLNLRPGMTGLWQVSGRDRVPFEDMVRLDYLYVTHWSMRCDIAILLRTLPLVLFGRAEVTARAEDVEPFREVLPDDRSLANEI